MPIVTYEEWLLMPEVQDATEEVINGEIRITPPALGDVSNALRSQLDRRRFFVVTSQFGLIIRRVPLTCRVPDLAVFLVREARSSVRARKEKLADYAGLGVPEIWAFNSDSRTVDVFYLEDGQLRLDTTVAQGPLKPRLFPNVQIDITQIWPN